MKKFSSETRLKNLKKLESEKFDLVIIGGGITGAGAARDASMRGLKVALIEASDFASGTSSRSSKLVHGGIRYLENKEFKLVFEALSERTKLFEMAPHLVHPLRFMIPLYQHSRVSMFLMGLGMWLYDVLSLFQAPELHERLNSEETIERMKILNQDALVGSYVYSDGYMDDDRLVHETLRSANEYGCVIANYSKMIKVEIGTINHKIKKIEVRDELTKKTFHIQCEHVISSVGPWTDLLADKIELNWKPILRPTKGIHITLNKNRLPLTSAVVMGAEKSDRIVFAIPRHEMVIIGTTDTDFKDDPAQVKVTREDIDYLLKVTQQYFPGAEITEKDIISSYAGVRPLVQDQSASEGKTSREHTIFSINSGFTFVAGGKYTTYRLMAEQVVDEAIRFLPFETRAMLKPTDTSKPLSDYTSVDQYQKSLYETQNDEVLYMLALRYGEEYIKIIDSYGSDLTYIEYEAYQAIHHTMCLNLTDFFTRRVPLFLSSEDHGLAVIEKVSEVFAKELNWNEQRKNEEILNYKKYIDEQLSWKLSFSKNN